MNNKYDLEDFVVPKMGAFLQKRRNTLITEDSSRELCFDCNNEIARRTDIDEIRVSDLKYEYTIKIYHYIKEPLDKVVERYSFYLLDNFKAEQIYFSLFGKYRKGQIRLNLSLFLDFFIFLIDSEDNSQQRRGFLIPMLKKFLSMRERTEIVKDL